MKKHPENNKSVCVIGLGYIGLPLASLLATKGWDVLGVDINPLVIDTLQKGDIHIVEPDLDLLVRAAVKSGNLRVSLRPEPADYFIICVPTPFKENHQADLSSVERAAEALIPVLREGSTVILESTVPSGTTRSLVAPILQNSGLQLGRQLFLAYCPERVLPGHIIKELVGNDRIIGGLDGASTAKAQALYKSFVEGGLHESDCDTAEMVKLVENAYRDVNIAFANELSLICQQQNLNVWDVVRLANKHPRVRILSPGPGVGGHCIAVDPWFIVEKAGETAQLIKTARLVNDGMPDGVVERVERAIDGIQNPKIACLGLSYKADIDDVRESPAVIVVQKLMAKGYNVICHDPFVSEYRGLQLASLENCLNVAHCAVLLVDHSEFKTLDWAKAAQPMSRPVFVDTRGIIPPDYTKHPSPQLSFTRS
jgi:UDP-N-acetyl-D-mannosaminuronic acid dehydrogenase